MALKTHFWIRFSIFNLFIVAFLGTLMRYKIGFSFPYFDQKHIQHAHSHFAFIGWITHTLFVLMVHVIQRHNPGINNKLYNILIASNLACAYGMLFSFSAQGYGFFSISFSTLSVFIGYIFSFRIFRDLKTLSKRAYAYWFSAGLWFNILASLGTFTLAFMMATHNFDQKIHLASLYFYLHFQYNGFFTFACIGLLLAQLPDERTDNRGNRMVFWMFFLSCIPAYMLSVLWIKMPVWLYVIVVIAAIVQVGAWIGFLRIVKPSISGNTQLMKTGRYLFLLIVIAASAKFLLQLGSTIPAVSKLAFGFRPIIIAYLHLILLAIISVFVLTYMYLYNFISGSKSVATGLLIFVGGVYLNEVVLGIQGIASFSYTAIPNVNEILFAIALLILTGIILLCRAVIFKSRTDKVSH